MGARSASMRLSGGQVSKRRNCIWNRDGREESPGSPYRPRKEVGVSGTGSKGSRGDEMDSVTLLKRGSGASSTGGGGACWRTGASVECAAGSGASAVVRVFRRLRPTLRARRAGPRGGDL